MLSAKLETLAVRDALSRLFRAAKRRAVRMSPIHRGRRRFNVHLQASPSWQLRAERAVELWTRNAAPLGYSSIDRPLVVGDLGCGNERLRRGARRPASRPRSHIRVTTCSPRGRRRSKLDAKRELPDREFDLVFTLGLLEYLSDLEGFLARIRRICRFAILSYVVSDPPAAASAKQNAKRAAGGLTFPRRVRRDPPSELAGWAATPRG